MHKPLVSILTPCYNVGKYIDRFIDSILTQTYRPLEVIFVNDGSTDNTLEIIKRRIPELEQQDCSTKLVDQENGGVSCAVNAGLKHFSGEYLTWPDPDDWLAPDSIEQRVALLEADPDAGTIRCNAEMIEDGSGKSLGCFTEKSDEAWINNDLFSDLSHIRTYFAPVCYMVRSSFFLQVNPAREIYHSRVAAQNLQMLLPITCHYPSIQTNKSLGFYLVRKGSLSRSSNNAQQHFEMDSVMCDVAERTLREMHGVDLCYLKRLKKFFILTKLAPGAYHARMKSETIALLGDADLQPLMRTICICAATLRASSLSRGLDMLTCGMMSKIENRVFRRLLAWRARHLNRG